MAKFILLLAALLLIVAFGLHTTILSGPHDERPSYTMSPSLMMLPWLSGFILPIFAWIKLTNIPWGWLLILNFVFVFFISPSLTRSFIRIFSSRRRLSRDMLHAFILGVAFLIVGRFLLRF